MDFFTDIQFAEIDLVQAWYRNANIMALFDSMLTPLN